MANPRPLHDNVWLLFASGDRDVGGVLSPQDRPEKWMDALVVAVGPEVPESAGFGVGDVVVANLFDGLPVDFEGRIYRRVPFSKVMAVLEPEGRKGDRHG